MSLKNGFLAIALLSGLSLAACSNTAAGVEQDARENADKAAAAADKAEDKARTGCSRSRGGDQGSGPRSRRRRSRVRSKPSM